jgi:hypothetical protein
MYEINLQQTVSRPRPARPHSYRVPSWIPPHTLVQISLDLWPSILHTAHIVCRVYSQGNKRGNCEHERLTRTFAMEPSWSFCVSAHISLPSFDNACRCSCPLHRLVSPYVGTLLVGTSVFDMSGTRLRVHTKLSCPLYLANAELIPFHVLHQIFSSKYRPPNSSGELADPARPSILLSG